LSFFISESAKSVKACGLSFEVGSLFVQCSGGVCSVWVWDCMGLSSAGIGVGGWCAW
jgi:hypothetical protein